MKEKNESIAVYKKIESNRNSLVLLNGIRGIAFRFDNQIRIYQALDDAKTIFYKGKQNKETSNSDNFKHFMSILDTIEYYGGTIGDDPVLILTYIQYTGLPTVGEQAGETNYDDNIIAAKKEFLMKHPPTLYPTATTNIPLIVMTDVTGLGTR